MYPSDEQILKLPKILVSAGVIPVAKKFYEQTGILKSYFSNVKNQEKYNRSYHFTPAQIKKVCDLYNINYNWVFGVSDEIFNVQKVHK